MNKGIHLINQSDIIIAIEIKNNFLIIIYYQVLFKITSNQVFILNLIEISTTSLLTQSNFPPSTLFKIAMTFQDARPSFFQMSGLFLYRVIFCMSLDMLLNLFLKWKLDIMADYIKAKYFFCQEYFTRVVCFILHYIRWNILSSIFITTDAKFGHLFKG